MWLYSLDFKILYLDLDFADGSLNIFQIWWHLFPSCLCHFAIWMHSINLTSSWIIPLCFNHNGSRIRISETKPVQGWKTSWSERKQAVYLRFLSSSVVCTPLWGFCIISSLTLLLLAHNIFSDKISEFPPLTCLTMHPNCWGGLLLTLF